MPISRRQFLIFAAALPLVPLTSRQSVAAFPKLNTRSGQARRMHYTEQAVHSRHRDYLPGQTCANCLNYNRLDDGCRRLKRRSVSANGWCRHWQSSEA